MVDATLSRNGTTVTLPLVDQGSGVPLVSRGTGHPHLDIRNTGAADPYFQDRFSTIESYSLVGRYHDSNAYADAIELADMIKNIGNGSPITLNIPLDEYDDDIKVVPAAEQESAATLTYDPGNPWVTVDLNLTRISAYQGDNNFDDSSDFISNTPTAAGTGPIQLSDGTNTVDLVNDIAVERTVGRPNDTISRRTDKQYPQYISRVKTAYDGFSISFDITDSNVATVRELNTMVGQKLKSTPLTLDFNGVYGMGAFDVVPPGSESARDVSPSGYEGVSLVPTLNLRRVRKI